MIGALISDGSSGLPRPVKGVSLCDIKNKWDIIRAVYYLTHRKLEDIPVFKYYKTDNIKLEFPDIKGFSIRNLKNMKKFAEEYSDFEFVAYSPADRVVN